MIVKSKVYPNIQVKDPATGQYYQFKDGFCNVPPAFAAELIKHGSYEVPPTAISIIMLTYNALEFTKKAIAAVLKNTSQHFELIIVDNNSNDGTVQYLVGLNDSRIKTVYSRYNLGVAGGRNKGLDYATADTVIFLDNDTEVGLGWDLIIAEDLKSSNSIGIVGHGGVYIKSMEPIEFVAPQGNKEIVDVVPGYCFAVKRVVFGIIGKFYTALPYPKFWHEDLEFCTRAKMAGIDTLQDAAIPIVHYQHKSMRYNETREQPVWHKGFQENATFIIQLHKRVIFIDRWYAGLDPISAYDRIANPLMDELRSLGKIVVRRPTKYTGIKSLYLCKAFEIEFNKKVYTLVFQENSKPPKNWAGGFASVNKIFTGSHHAYLALKGEPYKRKLIDYSLTGVNINVYNPRVKPLDNFYPDKFKFLMVGANQPRKNVLQLMDIFAKEFGGHKNIVLILKDGDYGQGNITDEYIKKLGVDNIVHIFDNWSSKYLARVYRTVAFKGAYIHPHKAECFGMPILEAAACGCRIGTTGWGGPLYNLAGMRYVTFFKYKLVPSSFHNHPGEPFYTSNEQPLWAEPNVFDIKQWMHKMVLTGYAPRVSNYNIINRKFSYEVIAQKLCEYLK